MVTNYILKAREWAAKEIIASLRAQGFSVGMQSEPYDGLVVLMYAINDASDFYIYIHNLKRQDKILSYEVL